MDWLLEARPSFSPPRRDLRPADSDPGATQYYSQRLDNLNTKYDRLLEQLSQRLKTAIEVNGSDGLVSISSSTRLIDEATTVSRSRIKICMRESEQLRECLNLDMIFNCLSKVSLLIGHRNSTYYRSISERFPSSSTGFQAFIF